MGLSIITLKTDDGNLVCERCEVARTPLSRMRGLLGRSGIAAGHGLLLRPAGAIHTFFMRFPIDAVFLDRNLRVLDVASHVEPWRTAKCKGAKGVLELAAGESKRRGLGRGDQLAVSTRV